MIDVQCLVTHIAPPGLRRVFGPEHRMQRSETRGDSEQLTAKKSYVPAASPMIASTFGDAPPVLISISDRHFPGFRASRFTAALRHVAPHGAQRILCLVHPGFCEVETGFFVLLIACEFLPYIVGAVFERTCPEGVGLPGLV